MKKAILVIILLLGLVTKNRDFVMAQQQAMFTQYMFNTLAINPAYAGSHETLSATAHFRSQWSGFDGAPQTQSFSAHGPLKRDNVALGLMILHDKVGVTSVTTFAPSYAYRIHQGSNAVLSLGLQANLTNAKSAFSQLNPTSDNDQALNRDIHKWHPNFGVGAYYYTNKYYVGLSMPMILKNDFSTDADLSDGDSGAGEMRPYLALTGGYAYEINPDFVLKPSFMMRTNYAAPLTVDLNMNVYFIETVGLGVSYRWKESIAAIAEIFVTEDIRIGYSYDLILNDINKAANGSHEIMINYKFPFTKRRIVTPRYF